MPFRMEREIMAIPLEAFKSTFIHQILEANYPFLRESAPNFFTHYDTLIAAITEAASIEEINKLLGTDNRQLEVLLNTKILPVIEVFSSKDPTVTAEDKLEALLWLFDQASAYKIAVEKDLTKLHPSLIDPNSIDDTKATASSQVLAKIVDITKQANAATETLRRFKDDFCQAVTQNAQFLTIEDLLKLFQKIQDPNGDFAYIHKQKGTSNKLFGHGHWQASTYHSCIHILKDQLMVSLQKLRAENKVNEIEATLKRPDVNALLAVGQSKSDMPRTTIAVTASIKPMH